MMLKRFRVVGLCLVAVFAIGAVAEASASAHEFIGSPVGGTIAASATTNQVFTINGGETVCTGLKATEGTVLTEKATKQLVTIVYEGCLAFGQKTKISAAHYEFDANGSVAVLAPIDIVIEELGFNCLVEVPVAKNEKLEVITYKNASASTISVEAKVTKITYTTTGGFCGAGGENGTYNGNALVSVIGGSVQWV
jgi:hypothetical protein